MKISTIGMMTATLVTTMGIATTGIAHAADSAMPPASGLYAGLGGGLSLLGSESVVVGGTLAGDAKFRSGWAAYGSLGYKWEDGFRTELEISHRENKARHLNTPATPLTGKQGDTSVMANILYDIPTQSRFTPYFGVGLGIASLDWHHVGAGPASFNDTAGSFAWQGIAGVAYAIDASWEALAQVRYKATTSDSSFTDHRNGTVLTGWKSHSTEFTLGLRYAFGGPQEHKEAAAAPAAPAPAPQAPPAPAVEQKFLVFFDFDKSNLREDAKKIVAQAAAYAHSNNKTTIIATGHTDTSGTAAYNMALSERRAKAVQAELERTGIPAGEINVQWKGKSQPLVQTGDGVKEPQNRRVEIVLE